MPLAIERPRTLEDVEVAVQNELLNLEWLLKIRTVIARIGEMDLARWWNSNGQLGPQGASVLRRGFPRTHYFAQARSVCMVAAARCAQIFDPPGSVTLWRLTDTIEERLDVLWEGWLDDAGNWRHDAIGAAAGSRLHRQRGQPDARNSTRERGERHSHAQLRACVTWNACSSL